MIIEWSNRVVLTFQANYYALGTTWDYLSTTAVVGGPYRVAQMELMVPGRRAGEIRVPGASVGEIRVPGQDEGEEG